MKLYDPLPDSIEWEGKTILLNLSFDRVLDAVDMTKDERFSDAAKTAYCLDGLCEGKHPQSVALLDAIFRLLFADDKKKKHKEKVIDFTQDRALIIAAFRQAYGIDLVAERGHLHWQTFADLLKGIPSGTRLAEVMEIRARPMPAPTKYNAQERTRLAKLKAEFKIEQTEAERQSNLQDDIRQMAMGLLPRAKRSE